MWAFYSSVSTLYEHWNVCRLCACNPTLEAFRCCLSMHWCSSLWPISVLLCLSFCPKMLPFAFVVNTDDIDINKVVYIHGLLPVHFISLHIENNGTEMVSHTWGAVLLHEVTTKLFPVELWVLITVEHFSPITCPLTKTTLTPSSFTFKTHGKVCRTLSCWFQRYLEKKSNLQLCVNIVFVFLLVFWRWHSSSPV